MLIAYRLFPNCFRFIHLYTSNHHTDSAATSIHVARLAILKLLSLKNPATGGMYNIISNNTKVLITIKGNILFLFLKLSTML